MQPWLSAQGSLGEHRLVESLSNAQKGTKAETTTHSPSAYGWPVGGIKGVLMLGRTGRNRPQHR